jgi:hypothetical protein
MRVVTRFVRSLPIEANTRVRNRTLTSEEARRAETEIAEALYVD